MAGHRGPSFPLAAELAPGTYTTKVEGKSRYFSVNGTASCMAEHGTSPGGGVILQDPRVAGQDGGRRHQ